MEKCSACGSGYREQTSREGNRLNYRCQGCAKQSYILVQEGPLALDGSVRSTAPCFYLTGRWAAKPAVKEVTQVSDMFPQLQAAGFSALWRCAVAREEIKFGCYVQEHADELAAELQKLGVATAQCINRASIPEGQEGALS